MSKANAKSQMLRRILRRRRRKEKLSAGSTNDSRSQSILGYDGGSLADVTSDAGTGGSGTSNNWDPTLLVYWLLLFVVIAIIILAFAGYGANN